MYTVEAQEEKNYFNAQMVDVVFVVVAAARFTGLRHLIAENFLLFNFYISTAYASHSTSLVVLMLQNS